MQNQELMEFISATVKTITRISLIKGAIYSSTLIFIIDNTAAVVLDLTGKVDQNTIVGFVGNSSGIWQDDSVVDDVVTTWHRTTLGAGSQTCIYEEEYLEENPNFMGLALSKASDGVGFYFMRTVLTKNLMIPVFSGFPLISKGDKVSIKLYMGQIKNRYMVEFKIFKKKIKSEYLMYYNILDINRDLRYI